MLVTWEAPDDLSCENNYAHESRRNPAHSAGGDVFRNSLGTAGRSDMGFSFLTSIACKCQLAAK